MSFWSVQFIIKLCGYVHIIFPSQLVDNRLPAYHWLEAAKLSDVPCDTLFLCPQQYVHEFYILRKHSAIPGSYFPGGIGVSMNTNAWSGWFHRWVE